MKRLLKCTLIIFLLGVLPLPSIAQTVQQDLYWIRYYAQFKLNPKFTWHFEIDDRRYFGSNDEAQLIIHNPLHYKWTPYLDVALGLSYASTHSQKNQGLRVPEWRPFQEVNLDFFPKQKLNRPLTFRFRLDERFVHENDGMELEDGTLYSTRFRFRLQSAWQLFALHEGKQRMLVKVYNEVMIHNGDVSKTFDQNRIYGGVEYYFHPNLSLEAGYQGQYQAGSGDKYYDRHILRMSLNHKINLQKKK